MPAPIQISGFGTNTCSGSLLNASSLLINQAICGCGGRVAREGDTANNISVSGVNWIIEPSAYFGVVYITPVVGPDQPTIIPVIIDSQITIPTVAGDGTLIIRIDDIYTDALNNTTSGYIFPTNASAFEFIPNVFTCEDIKTYLAGDGFAIIGSVVGGVLGQAPLAELCMPVNCDVMNECITNVVTDILQDISGVLPSLSILDNNGCAPNSLSWIGSLTASSPVGSQYRIYRNNILIATQPYSDTTFVDYSPANGNNLYRVDQYDTGTGLVTQSNQITVVNTGCYDLACGDFGDSSNGVLNTGGTMPRGVYKYSSINLVSQSITFSGSGPMIWLVDGNVNITGTTITSPAATNGTMTSMTIHGLVNNNLQGGHGTHGNGGAGGMGNNGISSMGGVPGAGGNGALYTAPTNSNAFGGYNGWANQYGQVGHDSDINKTFAAGGGGGGGINNNAFGGIGGVGGTLSGFQPSLIIICRGNFTTSGSTINGTGVNGTAGGNGSIGGYTGFGVFWGGSGGGGGGAGGSNGLNTYVYHLGTQSGVPTYNANGGLGGNGGASNPYFGNPATAGASGTNGNSGAMGSFTKIQLTC